MKIAKFGGSSLADATQFKKVKNIIQQDSNRKIVVVSAIGKRFKDDNKVTDLLYLCHAHLKYDVSFENIFQLIKERYISIKNELNLKIDLEKEFQIIRQTMSKDDLDYIVSRGEYLCAKMMSEYLGYDFIDAKDFILFDYNGKINFEKTKEEFMKNYLINQNIVVPGFYGSINKQKIKLMSRGGSDITGSILADILDADVYENFSDVSGILCADPRIVKQPKRIDRITYNELRELSYMGANVLHDEAIFPVKNKNIPINIRNTNDPDNPGTMILNDCSELDKKDPPHFITGIAGKKDFTSITIYKSGISSQPGVALKAFSVLNKYQISIENMPCGIDSFSLIVSTNKIQDHLYELLADLKEILEPDHIRVSDHLSLIAVVGRGMVKNTGISGKIFGELGNHQINIQTISQGADELNIILGVHNDDFEKTIQVIYEKFIRGIS
ncbi:MAG: aspartate kinase [Traorella sp.]